MQMRSPIVACMSGPPCPEKPCHDVTDKQPLASPSLGVSRPDVTGRPKAETPHPYCSLWSRTGLAAAHATVFAVMACCIRAGARERRDARVHAGTPAAQKILEDPGLAVDPVHDSTPNSPPSPNQPPKKAKIIRTGDRIWCRWGWRGWRGARLSQPDG